MITWREVATFGDLQRWLDEHDMAVSDLSRVYVAQKTPSPWKASVEPNNPANPIVAKLGATEDDFLERPHLCEVTEDGETMEDALLAVLRKVDEMLGNVQMTSADEQFFGPAAEYVEQVRERQQQDALMAGVLADSVAYAVKIVEDGIGGIGSSIPALIMFRQRRFVEFVARLLPAATQAYRDQVVEELFKK
jgi:hypothetical protein